MELVELRELEEIETEKDLFNFVSRYDLATMCQILYVGSEFIEVPAYDKYDLLLQQGGILTEKYDQLIAESCDLACTQLLNIDRVGLGSFIQDRVIATSEVFNPSLAKIDINRPIYSRSVFLEKVPVSQDPTVKSVAECFGLEAKQLYSHWELAGAKGLICVFPSDDSYADLWFDNDENRTAAIFLRGGVDGKLEPQQIVELSHEIGHCLNHLNSPSRIGDFDGHFLLSEYPAVNAERTVFIRNGVDSAEPFVIEFFKQATFSLFSLLAPALGSSEAFKVATKENPLYGKSTLTVEWLIRKPALFNPFLLPYIQYVVALDKLLLRDFSLEQYESFFKSKMKTY